MMRDQIAHPRRTRPVRFRNSGLRFLGKLLDGLADHLEVEQHGIEKHLVRCESLERSALDEAVQLFRAVDQIVQIEQPVTRHG